MDKDDEYWELLKDYSVGKVRGKQKEDIEKWLLTNEDARTTLDGFLQMKSLFNSENEMAAYFNNQSNIIISKTKKTSSYFLKIAVSFVLLFTIACTLYYYTTWNSSSYDRLLSDVSQDFYSAPFQTRDGISIDEWISSYQNKDFSRTITLLNQKKSLSVKESFYLTMSHFYLEEYAPSIQLFRSTDYKKSQFFDQKNWFLALAYLNEGKEESAIPLLEMIVKHRKYQHENAALFLELLSTAYPFDSKK